MKKKNEPRVEVSCITPKGCWLRIYAKKYFRSQGMQVDYKDYHLSFNRYPHFLGATKDEIEHVTICWNGLEWEALEVNIEISDFEYPRRRMYLAFTPVQLERLYKYNQEQIAKGGKPWLRDRLLDFPYWHELNAKGNTCMEECIMEKSIADISMFESLRTQANETLGMQSPMEVVDNMSPQLIPLLVLEYKFFIASGEGLKPHVHVKMGDKKAAFWLDPVSVESKGNMKHYEILVAMDFIEGNKQTFMEQYRLFVPLKEVNP